MNKSTIDRFMDKVFKRSDGCWTWIAYTNKDGYGQFIIKNKVIPSHRWIYEYYNGPLGDLKCRHKCNNPSCVNPDHLEKGTQFENIMDCVNSRRHKNVIKTHCPHGHEYTPLNTYILGTRRHCRECKRGNNKEERSFVCKPKLILTK